MRAPPSRLVAELRTALARRQDVELAILFGSRARGNAQPGSDLDLAVQGARIDLGALTAELSLATGLEVDVVLLADPGVPLLRRLVDEGIVVHEGSTGAAARWRSAALLALEIDGPWYARMRDAFLARVAERGV